MVRSRAMGSNLTPLDLFIWLSVSAAEALLVVCLVKLSVYRRFPIFFGFVCFGLLRELLLFYVAFRMSSASYFYAYWVENLIQYLFQFGVLYEVMQELFRPLEILPRHALKLFLGGCFFFVAIIAALSIAFPAEHLGPVITMIVYLERSSEFLRGATLLLLLPFVSMLGLRWRHHALGIVLGFGFFATVNLVCSAVGATFFQNIGAAGITFTRYIPKIAEVASFLIWIEYFRNPEPARTEVSPEVLKTLKGVSNQLEDLYTSPVGMVRRLMWQSSLQR